MSQFHRSASPRFGPPPVGNRNPVRQGAWASRYNPEYAADGSDGLRPASRSSFPRADEYFATPAPASLADAPPYEEKARRDSRDVYTWRQVSSVKDEPARNRQAPRSRGVEEQADTLLRVQSQMHSASGRSFAITAIQEYAVPFNLAPTAPYASYDGVGGPGSVEQLGQRHSRHDTQAQYSRSGTARRCGPRQEGPSRTQHQMHRTQPADGSFADTSRYSRPSRVRCSFMLKRTRLIHRCS